MRILSRNLGSISVGRGRRFIRTIRVACCDLRRCREFNSLLISLIVDCLTKFEYCPRSILSHGQLRFLLRQQRRIRLPRTEDLFIEDAATLQLLSPITELIVDLNTFWREGPPMMRFPRTIRYSALIPASVDWIFDTSSLLVT